MRAKSVRKCILKVKNDQGLNKLGKPGCCVSCVITRVFACTFGSFSLGPLPKALFLGKDSGHTFLRKASQVPGTDLSICIIMIHVGLIQLGTLNSDMCLQVHPQQDGALHSQQYHIPSLPKVPNDSSVDFMDATQRLFVEWVFKKAIKIKRENLNC